MAYNIHRPDETALRRLLNDNPDSAATLLLRLAWQQGLTRDEIGSLTWQDVRFEEGVIALPDREVPLCPEMAECLQARLERGQSLSPYVLISDRLKEKLSPESISRLARITLEKGGLSDVRLKDLRHDFILRQLETHDWPYVLRISGMSVTTFHACFADAAERSAPKEETPTAPAELDEFKLWKILQAEQNTAQGIAMWMTWQMGLQAGEMVTLTWEQVDMEGDKICLPERTIPLTNTVRRLLQNVKAQRTAEDDPHILLSPNSRKPMDIARLSKLTRTALIRGGLENVTLQDLRRDESRSNEDELILREAAEHGPITRKTVMDLLGLSRTAAYTRLRSLVERRKLTRIGEKYYLFGTVVEPEKQTETILTYINGNGTAYCQDIAGLLHVGNRQCAAILKKLVDGGVLTQKDKRYAAAAEKSD